jgi:hypothetical protein
MTSPFSVPQFMSPNPNYMEAFQALVGVGFDSTSRLTKLNAETARKMLERSATNTRALFGEDLEPRSAEDPAFAHMLAYFRGLADISTQAQAAVVQLWGSGMTALAEDLSNSIDRIPQFGPAGVGGSWAMAPLQTAIDATRAALDQIAKTTQQLTSLGETQVVAAADAVTAISSRSEATKGPRKAA